MIAKPFAPFIVCGMASFPFVVPGSDQASWERKVPK